MCVRADCTHNHIFSHSVARGNITTSLPHRCQVSLLCSVTILTIFSSFRPLSSDVVSSEGGDGEGFIPTRKTETGGVY